MLSLRSPRPLRAWIFLPLAALLTGGSLCAQAPGDSARHKLRFVYFPAHPQRAWTMALGVTATTMPYEVTEELHYRIPALEFSVLRRLPANFSAFARASVQGFQNYLSIGPRWSVPVTRRTSIGLSDEMAFWFGFNNFEGFKTSATGLQNFPALSAGIRFKKQVLLSIRAEAILTLNVNSRAGDIKINSRYQTASGSAYTVMLEQPFYGKKRMALGFRAAYTSFFWQTWSAFSTYDRNFFYPQLIACITW